MPKGYIVGHVPISDPEAYKAYSARNDELLRQFDGRFLVRGGASEILEGEPHERHVVLEFDSYDAARTFYNSPEYQENMKIRLDSSVGTVVVVEGTP